MEGLKGKKESAKTMKLQLNSPVGSAAIEYNWSPDDGANDIVNLIRLATTEFPQLGSPLRENYLRRFDTNKYESMLNLCAYFNKIMVRFFTLYKDFPETPKVRPSMHLVKGILRYVYDNTRSNFSIDDFGESCFLFICQLINDAKLTEKDTFVVLGSGIGQFVLQVAALSPCKLSVGIENLNVFNEFNDRQCLSFQKLLQWFGKPFGEFEFINGEFFQEQYRTKIISGKLIFIYNSTGILDLHLKLMEIFLDLENGTLIVSSESFIETKSLIEIGMASSIGVIKNIYEIKKNMGNDDSIFYYLHEINRKQVKKCFETVVANKNCTINEIILRKELTKRQCSLDSDFKVNNTRIRAKYKQQPLKLPARKQVLNDQKISQTYIALKNKKLFKERKTTGTSKSKIAYRISKKPDLKGECLKKSSEIKNCSKINTKVEQHRTEKSNVGNTPSLKLRGKTKSNETLNGSLPRRFSKRLLKEPTDLPKSNMKLFPTRSAAINKKNKIQKKLVNIVNSTSVPTNEKEACRLKSEQINGSYHFENCSHNTADCNPESEKPLSQLQSDTEQGNWDFVQKSAAPHFNYKEALSKSQSIHKTDKSLYFPTIRYDYKTKTQPVLNSNKTFSKILTNSPVENKDNETCNSSFRELLHKCFLDRYQNQYCSVMDNMTDPDYKTFIIQQIYNEKCRNRLLREKESILQNEIDLSNSAHQVKIAIKEQK